MLGRGAAAVLGVVLLAGCTSSAITGTGVNSQSLRPTSTARTSAPPATSASPSVSAGSSPPAATQCPSSYAAPDPDRPRVRLAFTVSDDHRTVSGTEHVEFRPDLAITELVFRLTANTRPTVAEGNRIVVTSARADHGAGRFTFSAANADPRTQGGLLHIPFPTRIAAGTSVTADLAFTLTLGIDAFDRFGSAGDFAYFASAQPLLSWQRGYGWHAEGMIDFPAESATSEAMDTDLTVIAPGRDTVIASGDPADPPSSSNPRTWHSHISAARDVSVSVGPFSVSDSLVGGVRLRLGAYSSTVRDELVPEFHRAITKLSQLLGPFPFPSLSVARVPAAGGGIEYPSSILMLDGSRLVAVHETAHQWYYAMVGDSQALHPWLDEAFAEYTEQIIDADDPGPSALSAPGNVDASTESYGPRVSDYYFTTYNKGAAALHAARNAVGADRWDRAIRCYIAKNAWRIVVPADFARAIGGFPRALSILRAAGALR